MQSDAGSGLSPRVSHQPNKATKGTADFGNETALHVAWSMALVGPASPRTMEVWKASKGSLGVKLAYAPCSSWNFKLNKPHHWTTCICHRVARNDVTIIEVVAAPLILAAEGMWKSTVAANLSVAMITSNVFLLSSCQTSNEVTCVESIGYIWYNPNNPPSVQKILLPSKKDKATLLPIPLPKALDGARTSEKSGNRHWLRCPHGFRAAGARLWLVTR